MRVGVFRPADGRLERAIACLESLGADPVADPLLAVKPTGAIPRSDADVVVLTSKTSADLLADWRPGGAVVCAIGAPTAEALEAAGITVDVVPETYSSRGLVAVLGDRVAGARVEVARSDHGSAVLLDGLDEAGAYHHETVLYRLERPAGAGDSTERVAAGELDAVVFTSALTVEHFLEAAAERGVRDAAIDGLNEIAVGVIGEPTRRAAVSAGITVDVVPAEATFKALAHAVVAHLEAEP